MNINDYALPNKYMRNGKECYLDPIRKKLIYVTPEEPLRQRVISYLMTELNVPKEAILVEEHLSHYQVITNRRADIIINNIFERDEEYNCRVPVAVIECKSEKMYLDDNAINQVFDYCDMIGGIYAMVINPLSQIVYKYDNDSEKYLRIEKLPNYNEMLNGKYDKLDLGELPSRTPFAKLEETLQRSFEINGEDDHYISRQTPLELSVPLLNFHEGLMDHRVKMPVGKYGLFSLIEDYGVRWVTYGNASGGAFFGPYRSFLVDVKGNTEIFSIALSTYCKSASSDWIRTCICVAHDDEKDSHHALQLVADENLVANGNIIDFYHSGRIAIGNIGSGKIDELRLFVKKDFPELIAGNRFYLGRLINNRLWYLDDPEMINVVSNLINYSIIRDEYREFVKKNKRN